jgi:hypothetical protein
MKPASAQQDPKPLSAQAQAKREARAARQAAAQQAAQQEDDMWENTYEFFSFSLRVQEEFGGESCVGGTLAWLGGWVSLRFSMNNRSVDLSVCI